MHFDVEDLTAARQASVENFKVKAARLGREGAVVNVSDNASSSWGHLPETIFPTLCKGSFMYSLSLDRPLHMHELWCIHGWPHPSNRALPASLTQHFPFPHLLDGDGLSRADQRRLIGNGMHWSQVGSWFLHQLACLEHIVE